MNKLYFAAIVLIIFCGCSGSKTEEYRLNSNSIDNLKHRINKNSNLIKTFSASGSISVESPEESSSGSFELTIKKPDSLLIKIEGPFGIDIASALITDSNFIYYNAQENKVITGTTNETNIGAILKLRMPLKELIQNLTGSLTLKEENGDSMPAIKESGNYLITLKSAGTTSKYFIEPVLLLVNKYITLDENDKEVLNVMYPKFAAVKDKQDSIFTPEQIIIKSPVKKLRVSIDYDSIRLNEMNLYFKMNVPKSAREIKWQ